MTRTGLSVVAPAVIWALHFAAVYALISAACAPRALIGGDTMTALAVGLTGIAATTCLAFLIRAGRARRTATNGLSQAAWWSALISMVAVLGNVWPFATLPGCTG